MPSNVVKLRRKTELGKAVMLGFELSQTPRGGRTMWSFTAPSHIERVCLQDPAKVPDYGARNHRGWVCGYFKWRHEAVTSALMQAGLLEGGTVTGKRTERILP